MKLLRLRVGQLRRFREPVEIRGLEPGLNLFAGPNESGKSTLVRAIRAAFFERFKSGSMDDLQPWGDSSAAPSVELEFEWQGERWKLGKRFLRQKRCDLEIGGRRFDGEAAEEKLAELLGYQFPGKGASKAQHWGVPGLLWIEQGDGQELREPVAHAGPYLKSALGESLGDLASSAGDGLIARVEAERAKLLTSTGRPTGEYAEVLRQHEDARARLEALDRDIAAYRQQVDRLAELRRLRAEDAGRPWDAYRRQAAEARTRLAEVQGWRQVREREAQALEHCAARQEHGRERQAAFARQREDLQQRARERDLTGRRVAELREDQPRIEEEAARAREDYRRAEARVAGARRQARRAELAGELDRLAPEQTRWAADLDQARTVQARLQSRRERLRGIQVDEAALKQLRSLDRTLAGLDAARQSAATRLAYQLLPSQQIRMGDETLAGQGERLLLEPVELDIPGVGRLRIRPGGEDVADLARRRQEARDRFDALLAGLGVPDLRQAEDRAEQARALGEDIRLDESLLAGLAPQGTQALEDRLVQVERRRQALSEALAALPPAQAGTAGEAGEPLDEAEAERGLESARERLLAAEQRATRHEQMLGLAEQAGRTAQAEWQRLQDAIQAPERQEQERSLAARLAELRAQEATLRQSLDALDQRIDAARPDILEQDAQRFSRTADTLEQAAEARREEAIRVQSGLEALGAHGLEEQRADLAREAEFIGRRRDELKRRAEALDLLLGLLRAGRQALTRRIQAPLQRHLNHYLQLLFPQARLDVDEDLLPERLVRPGADGPSHEALDALSFGAREQMGLISRLAYADLLREAGRPTLIILDDVLVHSDAGRLDGMKRILFDAAQRHQILLFTCHPERWRDLGARVVEMASLRAA
ncbi:AAA family ATPase [Castellaniella defragrans]|uniref:DNA double-strand break repair Rad50 ATPase n=1 Tax=Castellaniella defragrans (strain DSM 12143 / CCUG 39792 / 65Phen) TaxID=1437824 RepID=W8X5G4_CASD6|nr:AAA family ATPase [Castellaniella defragrans]CDM25622.1 DNA double-strand break repair Rad50 ATPase [Castellaniella defragrans 65Phen]